MPTYVYKARDGMGKAVQGKMDASNKSEVIERLNRMSYMATAVNEPSSGTDLNTILDRLKRVSSDDMLLFYIQFANLINAGLTILTSLRTLIGQAEKRVLKETVRDITLSVESGESLSKSFAGHPGIFPKIFVNMIKAGEASGKLDNVLLKYAEFYERQEDLKQKIKGALIYPMILLFAGTAVTLFIVTFVIPQFAQIYIEAGVKLPLPTQIVYNTGIAIKSYWYLFIAVVVAIVLGIKFLLMTEKGSYIYDKVILRIPIVGILQRKVAIARFSRTLATLIGSGVPILQSLEITRDVMGNKILSDVIDNVRICVERGEKMAEPLKVSGEFTPDLIQMVAIGEESGKLEEMLGKVADFYDRATAYAVKKLTTFIEPFFLVIMGIMIGFIMASMLMPMFDMIKTLRH